MTKVVILGDLHFGIKNDDPWIEQSLKRVITQVCDYVKKHKVKYIIQTGDWFDVRKGVSHRTVHFLRTEIMPMLESCGAFIHVIVGNHDSQFKDTITPNAVREHLDNYDVTIHDRPNTIVIENGVMIDMIPWYCSGNASEINSHIKSSSSDYCIGHWELVGHYMYSGMKAQSGLDPDFLKKYKQVFSGHYHVTSQSANVYYVGTPLTFTANDENDVKGFVVLDTDSGNMSFIDTNETNHIRISYPNDIKDYSVYENKSVRMVINEVDKNLPKVETLLEGICHEFRTVNNIAIEVTESDEIQAQQGLQHVIMDYIAKSSLEQSEKDVVAPLMQSLYVESV